MSTNENTTMQKYFEFRALFYFAGLFLLCGAAVALASHLHFTGHNILGIVGSWVAFGCSTAYLTEWIILRRTAGPVLADYGASPMKWPLLFVAAFDAVVFIVQAITLETYDLLHVSDTLFFLAFALFAWAWGMERVQLRQNGILARSALVKWHQIDAYAWTGESACTLRIRTTSVLSVLGRSELVVPAELKDEIEQRLQEGRATQGLSRPDDVEKRC